MKTSELIINGKHDYKFNTYWAMYKLLEHYYFITDKVQRDEAQ